MAMTRGKRAQKDKQNINKQMINKNTQKEKRNWRQHIQDIGLQIKQETEPKMQKNDSNLQTRHRTSVNKHGHKIN